MNPKEELLDVAVGAQKAWRSASSDRRRDALECISLTEILFVPAGSHELDIWLFPEAVSKRIILDHGCREEARRRGHAFDAPIETATAQALSLQDFRSELEVALDAVSDWSTFMNALWQAVERSGTR